MSWEVRLVNKPCEKQMESALFFNVAYIGGVWYDKNVQQKER